MGHAHELGLRLNAQANPALVAVGHCVGVHVELGLELLQQRLFVAAVGYAIGIRLRVVSDVAGANPVQEHAVDCILAQ